MNVELIVDSTVDVPEHIRSRLTVVPLTIHFGQEEYLDGVTDDKHRFYERLVESDVAPPSLWMRSLPTPPPLTGSSGGCGAAAAAPWC